jgi:hypothetical protein
MTVPRTSYTVSWVEDEFGTNAVDDNLDVTVEFATGERYVATMFTVANLQSLLLRYRESGECANGLYIWASNMIVLTTLDKETIEAVVADLIKTGEFAAAFAGPYK